MLPVCLWCVTVSQTWDLFHHRHVQQREGADTQHSSVSHLGNLSHIMARLQILLGGITSPHFTDE